MAARMLSAFKTAGNLTKNEYAKRYFFSHFVQTKFPGPWYFKYSASNLAHVHTRCMKTMAKSPEHHPVQSQSKKTTAVKSSIGRLTMLC